MELLCVIPVSYTHLADPWAETTSIQALAQQKEVPLFLTRHANHSLETGDIQADISALKITMEQVCLLYTSRCV